MAKKKPKKKTPERVADLPSRQEIASCMIRVLRKNGSVDQNTALYYYKLVGRTIQRLEELSPLSDLAEAAVTGAIRGVINEGGAFRLTLEGKVYLSIADIG